MYQKVESWFNIVALEKDVLKFWEEQQIFKKLVEKNQHGPPWSFIDGPITANNPMGVHHAWGRTLKDLYQRYWAMNGRKLRYQNGFDCQGLWVEVEVEKELGFSSKRDIENYGIDQFVQQCKKRVRKYSQIMTEQSKRLGYWMDWANSYYTMSDENNYTIWSFLKKCFEKGLVYKGHDVMPWCPRCGTGISQHEMQEGYQETSHLSVVVRFPILSGNNEALLVWTTTPWTLSSNVATAVHPEFRYLKVRQGDWCYYLAKSRAEIVLSGQGSWEVLEELTGQELVERNFSYTGPFDELPVQQNVRTSHKILPWKDVTENEGTGIVHIAPGCGNEDFHLGKEYALPVIAPIDEDGCFTEGFNWLKGQHASEVAPQVAQNLQDKGLLYSQEQYVHSYGHCWRCSKELLFRLVDEWFIAMDPWREHIKEVAKQISWIPSFGLPLELDWLSNMRDWMISKKRYWGLALPIWQCPDCQNFTVIGGYDELKERAIEGWEEFAGHSPHRPWIDMVKIACPQCGKPMSRVADVGNPWLDAGIVAYSTVSYTRDRDYWKTWVPADLILECFPGQYRHWFYSLIAMSTMMEDLPPCKTILGHAPVYDEHGEEMHKSKGNAIWFDDAVETMGADVMRWIYCTQELSSPLNFGYKKAKFVRGRFFNTLWNSYAFFVNYARLIGFTPPKNPSELAKRPDFDRWIIAKLQLLIKKCRNSFEAYDVRSVCRAVEEFLELLSNWYIRNNRRRYWHAQMDDDTSFAFETLFECLSTVLKLLAPILPMITETCYQNMVRTVETDSPESVHLNDYPVANESLIDAELVEDMDTVVKIHKLALSAREKAKVKIRQPLSKLLIAPENATEVQAVKRFDDLLQEGLNVKKLVLLDIGAKRPVEYRVTPNKRVVGQTYKAKANTFLEAIELHQDELVESAKQGRESFTLEVQGATVVLASKALYINEVDPPNLSIVQDGESWVAFATELSEDLRLEGLMRDFLRQIQVLRKEIGLEIEDRITVRYETNSLRMETAIGRYKDFICQELLCDDLRMTVGLLTGKRLKFSGRDMTVDVKRVM